jgi:hypothetical protein
MFDEFEDFAAEQFEISANDREEMADAFESMEDYYDDDMDGDFDSGMASAGFGTDEDYWCFEQDEF